MDSYIDKLSLSFFGMTRRDAHEKKVCISCKEPVDQHNLPTALDVKEYSISAMCCNCYPKAKGL